MHAWRRWPEGSNARGGSQKRSRSLLHSRAGAGMLVLGPGGGFVSRERGGGCVFRDGQRGGGCVSREGDVSLGRGREEGDVSLGRGMCL